MSEAKRGVGRPRTTTPEQLERVSARVEAGEALKAALEAEGVSAPTWYRRQREARAVLRDIMAMAPSAFFRGAWHD